MVVRGPTLRLRYPAPRDAPVLFEMARDPEVTRHFSWGPYRWEPAATAFIEAARLARRRGERLELVIVDGADRPLGITGLSELSRRDRRAVVGTWLGREHWGTGVNRDSKALVLALAFRSLGLLRVTAHASPDNARSLVALERLGFVHEGVLKGWHVHHGEQRDVAILRLMREEWEAGPLAQVPVEIVGDPPRAFT